MERRRQHLGMSADVVRQTFLVRQMPLGHRRFLAGFESGSFVKGARIADYAPFTVRVIS